MARFFCLMACLGLALPTGARAQASITTAKEAAEVPQHFTKPYRFTTDWLSSKVEVWTKHFGHLKGRPHLRYLEVGVWEGRSLIWVMENLLTHPTSRATALDIFLPAPTKNYMHNLRMSGFAERVTNIKGISRHTLRGLPVSAYDLIYIDGSHAGSDALTDIVGAWDLLKQGSLMILDDYTLDSATHRRHHAVGALPLSLRPQGPIDAFLEIYNQEIEILHRGAQIIIQRVPLACQQSNPAAGYYRNVKFCTAVGHHLYYWDHRQLQHRQTHRPTALSPKELALLEKILRRPIPWPNRTQAPKAAVQSPREEQLLGRLGVQVIR